MNTVTALNAQRCEINNSIGVASYGALGHVPPLDYQLVKILREQIRKMYKNNAIFAQFLSIFGPFCHFLATVFLRE